MVGIADGLNWIIATPPPLSEKSSITKAQIKNPILNSWRGICSFKYFKGGIAPPSTKFNTHISQTT